MDLYPLQPFEHLMLADDRPQLPMTFFVRATFDGVAERARFTAAVHAALGRHPQLCAFVNGHAAGRTSCLQWIPQPDAQSWIDWATGPAPFVYPRQSVRIDLRQETGVRFFVRTDIDRTVLTMQLHHSASDATGACQLLEDILAFYGSVPEKLRPVDPTRLLTRHLVHQTPQTMRRRIWLDIGRAWKFFSFLPAPVATDTVDRAGAMKALMAADTSGTMPRSVEAVLDAADFTRIRRTARRLGVTINDFLLWACFLAFDAWNKSHGRRHPVRVSMPINMRVAGKDDDMPVTNVVSMCFLDRSGKQFDDKDALLRSIHQETTGIKSNLMGITLLRVADLLGRVPGGLRWLMSPGLIFRCASTVVLSNLGAPLRNSPLADQSGRIAAGGLILRTLELLPPVRPGTAAAIGVVTLGEQVSLTLHYDSAQFTELAAFNLMGDLKSMIGQLSEDVGAAAGKRPPLNLEKWRAIRSENTPLRGLAIGKGVVTDPHPFQQQLEAGEHRGR